MEKEFTLEYEKFNELSSDEKRFYYLNNIYNYFTNLTEKDKEVWDVKVINEGISEIVEVRVSSNFLDDTDIPLFRFHSDNFRSSFDKLNTPFQFVEINTDIDSENNSCNHWLVEMNEGKNLASVTKKPADIFTSNSDLDSELKILQVNDEDKSNLLLKDFLAEIKKVEPDIVVPELELMFTSIKVYKPFYNSIHDKDQKSALKYYYNLVQDSRRSAAYVGHTYLLSVSKETQKKFLLKTAAIAGGGLLAAGLLIKGFQIFEEDFEGRTKEVKIENQVNEYEELTKELVENGELEFQNYINTIVLLSKKWGVEPKELGVTMNRYRIGLDKYLSENQYNNPTQDRNEIILEELMKSIDVQMAKGENPFNGSLEITKSFIMNILKVFPFLKSGLLDLNIVKLDSFLAESETYIHRDTMFYEEVIVSPAFGDEFIPINLKTPYIDTNTATTVVENIHEITHTFMLSNFEEVIKSISPEKLAILTQLKYQIADELVTDWAKSRSSEILFSFWFLNSASLNIHELKDIIIDFEPENFNSINETELNSFIQRTILKRFEILKRVESGEELSSEENDFMYKYYKYDFGNKIMTHALHHLEDIVPISTLAVNVTNSKISVYYLNKYFELLSNKVLGKTPEAVLKEINQNIFGVDLEFNGDIPKVFDSLARSDYASSYNSDGHLVSVTSVSGTLIALNHNSNQIICTPEHQVGLSELLSEAGNENNKMETSFLSFNDRLVLKKSDKGEINDPNGKPVIVCDRVGLNPGTTSKVVKMKEKGDNNGLTHHTVIITTESDGSKEYFIRRDDEIFDMSQVKIISDSQSPRLVLANGTTKRSITFPYAAQLEVGFEVPSFEIIKHEPGLNITIGKVGYLLKQENFDKILVDKQNIVDSRVRYKIEENQLVPELMYKRTGDDKWTFMVLSNPQYYPDKG